MFAQDTPNYERKGWLHVSCKLIRIYLEGRTVADMAHSLSLAVHLSMVKCTYFFKTPNFSFDFPIAK